MSKEALKQALIEVFPESHQIEISEEKNLFKVKIKLGEKIAEGQLKQSFWAEYLNDPQSSCRSCVFKFYEFLEAQLSK